MDTLKFIKSQVEKENLTGEEAKELVYKGIPWLIDRIATLEVEILLLENLIKLSGAIDSGKVGKMPRDIVK